MDLFSRPAGLTPLGIEDGELALLDQLPLALSNEAVLGRLIAETAWRSETIRVWGRQVLQPRLTAWHGERTYRYSGLVLTPLPLSPLLEQIKLCVEQICGREFNSVLLNYYRNERDSMGMHSDNEPELGPEPAIASLSFGARRTFVMRHKRSRRTIRFDLETGSLLLMSGRTQENWLHGINKSARPHGARVNLTFRYIY